MQKIIMLVVLMVVSHQSIANPNLAELYQTALSQSPALQKVLAQQRAAAEAKNASQGGYYPQLSLQGSYTHNESNAVAEEVTTKSLSLVAQQALYKPAMAQQVTTSDLQLQLAQLEVEKTQQDILLEVVKVYLQLLLAQENLKLYQAQQKTYTADVQSLQSRVEKGLASRLDLLQAQANLDESKTLVLQGENDLINIQAQFTDLVGELPQSLGQLNLNAPLKIQAPNLEDLLANLQQQNLSIKQARLQQQIAKSQLQTLAARDYPEVQLQARVSDLQYSDFDKTYQLSYQDRRDTQVSVNLAWSLYAGGADHALQKQYLAQSQAQEAVVLQTEKSQILAAKTQRLALEQTLHKITSLRSALASAETYLAATQDTYALGLKTFSQLEEARFKRDKLQRDLLQSMLNAHNLHLQLLALQSQLNSQSLAPLTAQLQ